MLQERVRLSEPAARRKHWKRWGPYLSERAWGTVREDYSPNGDAWEYFPHEHARSRAYRWNEDGIAGICDRHQLICFAVALWNERDPILNERVFAVVALISNSLRSGQHTPALLYEIPVQVSGRPTGDGDGSFTTILIGAT